MISPYPRLLPAVYTQTRPQYNDLWGSWLVSRHPDVRQVLTDDRLTAAHGAALDRLPSHTPLVAGMQAGNERRHLDLRRAVEPPLQATAIGFERFAQVASIVNAANVLLDRIVARRSGQVELVEEYTRPLAAYAMYLVMGLPTEAAQNIWPWLDEQIDTITPAGAAPAHQRQWASWLVLLDERRRKAADPLYGVVDYLRRLQASRRWKVAGKPLSDEDIAACCTSVMALGTASLAGGIATTLALLDGFTLTDAVRADLSLVPDAVREALRYEPPFPTIHRLARTDLEINGQRIRAGQWVTASLLAADRDPAQFDDPDTYKLGRSHDDDLAWGLGEHCCPVRDLAEKQLQVGLYQLLRRLPGLQVDPAADLRRRWPALVPGLVELPCNFDANAALAVQSPAQR